MYFLLTFILQIIRCTDPDHKKQYSLNHCFWIKCQSIFLFFNNMSLACQKCSAKATK